MKKTLALLFVIPLALCLAACSSSKEPQIALMDGYEYYESQEDGIRFQFPETWAYMDLDILNNPDTRNEFEQKSGMDAEMLLSFPGEINPTFYNMDVVVDAALPPSLSFVTRDTPGDTQEMLKSYATLEQAKLDIHSSMDSQIYDWTSWIVDPTNKRLGDNEFIWYLLDCSIGDQSQLSMYQAMTIGHGKSYLFTYVAEQGTIDDDTIAEIEKILSTVEFL